MLKIQLIIFAAIAVVIVVGGINVISISHQNSLLISEIQNAKKEYRKINDESVQLLLEQKSRTDDSMINSIVKQRMLSLPQEDNMVYIK